MAGAVNVTMWALQQNNTVNQAIVEKTNTNLARLSEKIEISEIRIDKNKFNMTLTNDGGSAARVKTIYVVNETASPKTQYRYDVDMTIDGRTLIGNVGQSLALVARNTTTYSVKVVTETGNSATAAYSPLSTTALPLAFYVIPPTVTTGENVTLLYSVTNNNTNSKVSLDIYPKITATINCNPGPDCGLTKLVSGPTKVTAQRGSTVFIKEVYKVVAPQDTTATFNASFIGAKQGNYIIEKTSVIVVASSITVLNNIATVPDIYLMVPGPFGTTSSSTQRGLWGAVIANPTEFTMNISRVVITAYTAEHSSSTDIIVSSAAGGCNPDPIYPSTGWSCPHDNAVEWKNLNSPVLLRPGDVTSFRALIRPGGLGGGEEPASAVAATIYTDIGRFSKSGYTTGMTVAYSPLGNVYLTNTIDTGSGSTGALNKNNMLGNKTNIAPGSNQTFYVAVADLDTRTSTFINAGHKFIIDVPADFKNVTVTSAPNFNTPVIKTRIADGVTQIVATTTGNTGDAAAGEVKIIRFWAIAPSPDHDTTYIMTLFTEGKTSGCAAGATCPSPTPYYEFSSGALAEIGLQVEGTS